MGAFERYDRAAGGGKYMRKVEKKLAAATKEYYSKICPVDAVELSSNGHCPVCGQQRGEDRRIPPEVSESRWLGMTEAQRLAVRQFHARRLERDAERAYQQSERERAKAETQRRMTGDPQADRKAALAKLFSQDGHLMNLG